MSSRRNHEIKIRLTDEEFEHINSLVKDSGLSREQYTRMLYENVIPRPCPSEELLESIQQLRRIGNNMNQIAFITNVAGNIDKDYYVSCFHELQNEIFKVKEIMLKPATMK